MDLSTIIISYNTREITAACLQSVFSRVPDARVIVVDNASADGSVEAITREFPQVRLIRNANNRGFAAANNQAIRATETRYVLLLNSDTVVVGNALSQAVQFMDENPYVGVMGCRVLNPDGTLQRTCFQYPSLLNLLLLVTGLDRLPWPRFFGRHQMRHWLRDDERDVDVVTGCFMLVRREAIEQVGLLDESFFFCGEETDWCKRFREAGWKVRFAPVGEIIHIGNASGRRYSFRRDLMLSEGLVRLHRKHSGLLAAAIAWLLLWIFNATRAAFWLLRAALSPREQARQRRDHFVAITRSFRQAWPSPATRGA